MLIGKTKSPCKNRGFCVAYGGGIGIRTLDTLLTYASFQDWCIQPLCHPTKLFYQGHSDSTLASKALIIQCLFALTSSNYSFTAFSSDSVAAGI